jgi:hypothetical protein
LADHREILAIGWIGSKSGRIDLLQSALSSETNARADKGLSPAQSNDTPMGHPFIGDFMVAGFGVMGQLPILP